MKTSECATQMLCERIVTHKSNYLEFLELEACITISPSTFDALLKNEKNWGEKSFTGCQSIAFL